MNVRAAIGTALAGVLLCAVAAAAVHERAATRPGPDPRAERRAVVAADRFLDRYVDRDGRVVRRDEGGDTVSEGQAYAMLAAVAIGDEVRFRRVWRWTRRELERDDRLLSWHWQDGRVIDAQSASDADLDAARALVLAGRRFADRRLRREGIALGRAVLDHETIAAGRGRRLQLAGPWARERRVVNPSYLAPRAYGLLDRARPDRRWSVLVADARTIARDLLAVSPGLPPDWAEVRDGGKVEATGAPGRPDRPPAFGLDAQRLLVRFAESCSTDDHALVAKLWPFLRDAADAGGLAQWWDLRGRPSGTPPHPLTFVAAAAAARTAADGPRSRQLLAAAEQADHAAPSYYGAAWVALGRLMLDTKRLGGCAPWR